MYDLQLFAKAAAAVEEKPDDKPKRELNKLERYQTERGKKNWWASVFPEGDDPSQRMSSPGKGALLYGLGGGWVANALGNLANSATGHHWSENLPARNALVMAGIGGGGLLGYLSRQRNNTNVISQLRRSPPPAA